MDQGVGRVEGLNFGETTTRKVTVTGGKKRERANQIGNTYAIRVTTTTREDFNMHRLTDVPQHADFKCKYKSAMQTAELVWAALGWRRFRKGCERIAYNGGRTISRVPPLLCIRVYACVCVCMRVFVEQSNYKSLPLCFLAVEVYIRGNGACSLCPVDSYERSFSLVSA